MLVKNKKSGDVENLHYGPANDAVAAGTHEFVNVDQEGKPIVEKAKGKSPAKSD